MSIEKGIENAEQLAAMIEHRAAERERVWQAAQHLITKVDPALYVEATKIRDPYQALTGQIASPALIVRVLSDLVEVTETDALPSSAAKATASRERATGRALLDSLRADSTATPGYIDAMLAEIEQRLDAIEPKVQGQKTLRVLLRHAPVLGAHQPKTLPSFVLRLKALCGSVRAIQTKACADQISMLREMIEICEGLEARAHEL